MKISPLGCAPYGFAYVKKRDGAPASYRVLLHEAKVVRDIFHAFVHEQKSIGDIARELSAREIPTRRGAARWGRPTVWTILRNPAHMGKAAYGKSEAASEPRLLRPRRGRSQAHAAPRNAHASAADKWISIDVPAIVSPDAVRGGAGSARAQQAPGAAQRTRRALPAAGADGVRALRLRFHTPAGPSQVTATGPSARVLLLRRRCAPPLRRSARLPQPIGERRTARRLRLAVGVCELLQDPRACSRNGDGASRAGLTSELKEQRDEAARAVAAQERA